MKEVINLQGEKELVAVDTTVKTVNGTHYLLTEEDEIELAEREEVWAAGADDRKIAQLIMLRKPLFEEADQEILKHEDNDIDARTWRTYRQKLRDITKQEDLDNIEWPIKPNKL